MLKINHRSVVCILLVIFSGYIYFRLVAPRKLRTFGPWRLSKVNQDVTKKSSPSSPPPQLENLEGILYEKKHHIKRDGKIFLNTSDLDHSEIHKIGEEFLKKQTIAIGGALRNVQRNLAALKKNLLKIISLAKNHSILMVENDSRDRTRHILLQWRKDTPNVELLGCVKINEPCHIPMKRGHTPGGNGKDEFTFKGWQDRVALMAKLRNFYLDRTLAINADFLISYEMDLTFDLPKEYLFKAFYLFKKFPHIDSLCAHGINDYGGTWDACTIVLPPISKWQTFLQGVEHVRFVEAVTKFTKRDKPVKVLSCFGGLAIYRVSSLRKYSARYDRAPPAVTTCEHNMLSYKLSNNYLVPGMRLKIKRNWSL